LKKVFPQTPLPKLLVMCLSLSSRVRQQPKNRKAGIGMADGFSNLLKDIQANPELAKPTDSQIKSFEGDS
jgi:hypothetical protein